MNPTIETSDELTYDLGVGVYHISKTDPPVVTMIVNYGHPAHSNKPQTWLALKALFDAQD